MEPTKRMHPLAATAAFSLIILCITGVAAMTGLLPSSKGSDAPPLPPAAALSPSELPAAKPAEPAPPPRHAAATEPRVHVAQAAPLHRAAPVRTAPPPVETVAAAPACTNCGRVESVHAIEETPQTNGVGLAAGAVIGGLLGNQVGGGNGRKLATVAGVIGGTVAGNEVEKRVRGGAKRYEVRVRMNDGSMRSFTYDAPPAFNTGDRIEVINGQLGMRG